MNAAGHKAPSATGRKTLLATLRRRFDANRQRHPDVDFSRFEARLAADPKSWRAIAEMERTGGEPDVVGFDTGEDRYIVVDCSPESPASRRSLCYDRQAQDARKANRPEGNAVEMAAAMGIDLLDEVQYALLQQLGEFDLKTSSWLATPDPVRSLGGALFGDRRFDRVFVYCNGAQSYYAARGFRGVLRV